MKPNEIALGTRIVVVSIDGDRKSKNPLLDAKGILVQSSGSGHPENWSFRMSVEWPPDMAGQEISLCYTDDVEEIKPLIPRYPIEYVKTVIETALNRLGFLGSTAKIEVSEDFDYDHWTDTELRSISVQAGWVSFDLCEVIHIPGPIRMIGYQPTWTRSIPARGMTPEDVDITEGEVFNQPTSAIEEGIVRCLRETLSNACDDALMYQNWAEEQKETAAHG